MYESSCATHKERFASRKQDDQARRPVLALRDEAEAHARRDAGGLLRVVGTGADVEVLAVELGLPQPGALLPLGNEHVGQEGETRRGGPWRVAPANGRWACRRACLR